jgi:SAM-dependent methyltransferase
MSSQYQSFPDAAGDSRTLDKLKSLRLPSLMGKHFLDVGSNEGFFCGYAAFEGAARSVGLDRSAHFISRARERFPTCEFLQQGWDALPDDFFDVILLASALHYADDQPALIRSLVDRLAPEGVLVLEMGIASTGRNEWVKVRRGIDEREFPTMQKVRETLRDYAWKWMGPSIRQDGDPVARHVVHVSRRRPVVYLLMQPPGYGKTSIATRLFSSAKIPVVSGDQQIDAIVKGRCEASPALQECLREEYSPFAIDKVIERVFARGLGEALATHWIGTVGEGRDFALDAYVPVAYQARLHQTLLGKGYLPVQFNWDRMGPVPMPSELAASRADAFYLSLVNPDAPHGARESTGFVDEVQLDSGMLAVRGWAVDTSGQLPQRLTVALGDAVSTIDDFEKMLRPDVQAHLGLAHALVGFRFRLDVRHLVNKGSGPGLRVWTGEPRGRPLEVAGTVDRTWTRRG